MNEKQWYIIYTSGIGNRAARQIQSLIDRLGLDCILWVPTQKTKITRYGKEQDNNKPLFPSYVFLYASINDSQLEQALIENKLGKFLKVPGADVGDNLPSPISESDIQRVKSNEENGAEAAPEEIIAIEVGNLIEVSVGPFQGIRGIVTQVNGHDVHIETLMFGRSAPVRVNSSHLFKLTETVDEKKATEKN